MRPFRITGATVLLAGILAAGCGEDPDRVIVAAGTTIVDSGVADALAEAYEAAYPGSRMSVVGLATREALELGRRGAADILITHAPAQEAVFLEAHPAARSHPVFASRFLLVGPADRSSALAGATVLEALQRIAREQWRFVTRADGSGTYDRELALWTAAGVLPAEPWYLETGQGMGNSLQVADQRGAFILVEEGTYLAASDVLSLVPVDLQEVGDVLANPYTAILPEPRAEAEAFLDWLVSPSGREALRLANAAAFGREVFKPTG